MMQRITAYGVSWLDGKFATVPILLVAYTGVFGLVLYVLGCREPLRGTHEQFVAARWRQVLGSTMH